MAKGRINKDQIASKDVFKNLEEGAKSAETTIKSLEITLKSVVETAKLVKSSAVSSDPTNNKGIKERNELLAKSDILVKSKIKTEKQLQTARLAELRLQKQREKAFDKFEKGEKRRIKQAQVQRKSTIDSANAFKKLTKQVNNAQDRFKRLAAQYGETDKRTQKALSTFTKLDSRLRSINNTARDGRRDVGRYGLALKGVSSGFKSLLLAGGVIGVIRGVGRAFKDAFDRVREFDAQMRNLAGISGLTLKELQSTKEEINRVAAASTKTSGEVAKLATTLFSLGKSQSEVNKLLKPTNDLSIALQATSDEAGELLVSTLNAFQKGADSGQHFADVIAKMRTSTSLDFERIKDSLGFVAATANVMNLTIGETGALIGVLQDNGFKAARAGRLLNSSFIKLAKEGKTLEGSLERINKAQERGAKSSEILRIAEKDFGLQSASLGVILASNRDRIAELSNEFDNLSEGSLEKLTNEQLKSLNAQLKITESTWESLILSIESGDGAISAFFKNALSGLNKFLVQLRRANQTFSQNLTEDLAENNKEFIGSLNAQIADTIAARKKGVDEEIKILESRKNRGIISEKSFIDEKKRLNDEFDKFSDGARRIELIKEKEFLEKTIEQQTKGTGITIDNAESEVERLLKIKDDKISRISSRDSNFALVEKARANQKSTRDEKLIADSVVINKDRIRLINLLLDEQQDLNDVEEEEIEILAKKKKAVRELTGLIELQAKAVADLNKQIKEARTEDDILNLAKQNDVAKTELARLKRIVSSSIEEFNKQQLDLIEDHTEKVIAKEQAKNDKLIALIRSNAKVKGTTEERLTLEQAEAIDKIEANQAAFKLDAEIKRDKKKIKLQADLSKAEFNQTRSGFKTEADFEKEQAEQLRAIKIIAINEELELLKKAGREKDKLRIEQLKAERESLFKFKEETNEINTELLQKAIQFQEDLIIKSLDRKIEVIGEEGKAHKESLNEFKDAARDGSIIAKESLAEEERLAEESVAKQRKIEQDKQNVLFVTSVLKAYAVELENPENKGNSLQAFSKAVLSVGAISAFASALPAFLEGTEDTGRGGNLDSNGGFHAILHENERVLTKDQNAKIGNFTNEEVAQTMEKKRMGNLVGDTQIIAMANGVDMSGMEAELKDIKRAIIDKPENKIELGAITQATMEIVETRKVGNRTTFNRFKVRN